MQSGNEAIPDDIEALKAALAAERAMSRATVSRAEASEADAAAAKASRSDDQALIAHLKLTHRMLTLDRRCPATRLERRHAGQLLWDALNSSVPQIFDHLKDGDSEERVESLKLFERCG